MKIIIDTPEKLAAAAAERYVTLLNKKPDAVLGLATGSTPLALYARLAALYAEKKISFDKAEIKRAQDRPFIADEVLHVDFGLVPNLMTKEPRPRCVYRLVVFDPATKTTVADKRVSVSPESGLRHVWETMPAQFLKLLIENGRVPGEVKVASGRVFRMLRPLCMELPFKLSLHDRLELP